MRKPTQNGGLKRTRYQREPVTCSNLLVHRGVDFLKSDNCASYALDPSVRFGAMRDALNHTGAKVLLSIEPFTMTPDPEQSVKISVFANLEALCAVRTDPPIPSLEHLAHRNRHQR